MKNNKAFSLLELSIVLVIIGLIAGGIVAGASMIRAAELRSVATDIERIKTSVYTFKDKYLALPGDMKNATDFWGISAGTTGNDDACYTHDSTSEATCNGNGNGQVHVGHTLTGVHERGRFWQHLANAQLVSGSYTGNQGLNGATTRFGGTNAHASSINGTHYNIAYVNVTPTDTIWFKTGGWHLLEHTVDYSVTAPPREILTPTEAWSIDKKIDDGRPGTGIVMGPKDGASVAPNCTTTDDAATSEYDLDLESKECYLSMDTKF